MNVKITTRNCKIKKREHDYIIMKISHLSRFHIVIDHVEVIVKQEGFQYELELIVSALHKNFLIKKNGASIEELVDILVTKMGQQLVKHKEKVKSHRAEKKSVVKEVGSDTPYSLVYKSLSKLKKMTHKEAADAIVNSKEKILIYIDSYTEKLSVATLKGNIIEIIEG